MVFKTTDMTSLMSDIWLEFFSICCKNSYFLWKSVDFVKLQYNYHVPGKTNYKRECQIIRGKVWNAIVVTKENHMPQELLLFASCYFLSTVKVLILLHNFVLFFNLISINLLSTFFFKPLWKDSIRPLPIQWSEHWSLQQGVTGQQRASVCL